MRFCQSRFWLALVGVVGITVSTAIGDGVGLRVKAQNPEAITLRSDVQEANTTTGVITARGNVYIDYPAQRIHATSAQAQYYSNERRIVLSGNVVIHQEGNTLRAEVVTYLIDESRFVAAAAPNQQVQAVYHLPTNQASDNLSVNPPPMGSSSNSSAEPPLVLDLNPVNSPAP
jgi:lipopolysaccharide export system protein LptA